MLFLDADTGTICMGLVWINDPFLREIQVTVDDAAIAPPFTTTRHIPYKLLRDRAATLLSITSQPELLPLVSDISDAEPENVPAPPPGPV